MTFNWKQGAKWAGTFALCLLATVAWVVGFSWVAITFGEAGFFTYLFVSAVVGVFIVGGL